MLPTLKPGKIVVARPRHNGYQSGDIVIFDHDGLEKIKRVAEARAGKPGDLKRQLFVLGDNKAESTDSRAFGWINESIVKGRLVWPRNKS